MIENIYFINKKIEKTIKKHYFNPLKKTPFKEKKRVQAPEGQEEKKRQS
jgi:hypothetical protein